ncbi:MAG: DUF4860 domain-containing protein [Firmicutes bacterium]|nr:DUF4860 domain-containing protein [Bacillota bacterium]
MRQGTKNAKMNGMVVLLLFAILAVCVLSVLLMGAKAYRGVTERDRIGFERRTTAQYIAARLHQGDQSGAILVRDFSGESSLVLKEDIDGTVYETIVYCHEGYLCELFVPENSGFEPVDGTRLTELTDLEFQREGNLLTAEITYTDGSVQVLDLALRSERGSGHEE